MLLRMIYDHRLAQAAYLIGCQKTGEAIVVDPQRDIQRYVDIARSEGLEIKAVAETHIHADFLSGSRQFAEEHDVMLYLSAEGGKDWSYRWPTRKGNGETYTHTLLKNQDTFMIGNIEFRVWHTPGHTPEHISFLVTDRGAGASKPMGMATGDFVFVGDVGRPDLLETAAGQSGAKEPAAKMLYKSVTEFQTMPDYLQVWPGHGSGSACGKALGAVPQSTVGYEKLFNASIVAASSEETFVQNVLSGQPEPPLYFARMKQENRDGPAILSHIPIPQEVNASQIESLLQPENVWVDMRPKQDFIKGHLPGALFAPLNNSFPTITGSYIEPDRKIYLVCEKEELSEAVNCLIRIGLDNISGFVPTESFEQYEGSLHATPARDIAELLTGTPQDAILLDVRHADEYESGHLEGAMQCAHTRLAAGLDRVPEDKPVLVYCRSGARSMYATALLQGRGYDATQLDGGILAWLEAGGSLSER